MVTIVVSLVTVSVVDDTRKMLPKYKKQFCQIQRYSEELWVNWTVWVAIMANEKWKSTAARCLSKRNKPKWANACPFMQVYVPILSSDNCKNGANACFFMQMQLPIQPLDIKRNYRWSGCHLEWIHVESEQLRQVVLGWRQEACLEIILP